MKQCCKNCFYFESGGYCGLWKSQTNEVIGINDFSIGYCSRFKEKIMKCPLEITNEFNEWNNICQECQHYNECLNNSYNFDKQEPKDPYLSNNTTPTGDNFPIYGDTHFRTRLYKEHKERVNKLFKAGFGKITQDDILDIIIDIENYNKECRKQKIKTRYKREKEKNGNL
jgi:hypothetical protein